jgi:hypothetical protein
VTEQHERALARRLQPPDRDRALGELDGHDPPAGLALLLYPALPRRRHPVDARPARQRVALGQRLPVVRRVRHGHAGADGVARPQERAEVGFERHPQRGDEQVVPATVAATTARATDVTAP